MFHTLNIQLGKKYDFFQLFFFFQKDLNFNSKVKIFFQRSENWKKILHIGRVGVGLSLSEPTNLKH